MWMECISDHAYRSREHIAEDIVRVLREEVACLLAAGAALVQLDEPVLSEVVFTGAKNAAQLHVRRAVREGRSRSTSSAFARDLINQVVDGFPRERLALHMCRGNWTPDESRGARRETTGRSCRCCEQSRRRHLLPRTVHAARRRDGGAAPTFPTIARVGVGVVNQKHDHVETAEEIVAKAERAIKVFGARARAAHPDCGFATFADNPVASAQLAEAKMRAIADAAATLRGDRERKPR